MTREVEKMQLEIGAIQIAAIKFDPRSRDDIPKILKGLQYIYVTDSIREPYHDDSLIPLLDHNHNLNQVAKRPSQKFSITIILAFHFFYPHPVIFFLQAI